MKTIIKIFAAVLAAVPVLVSCYSEPLPEVIPEVIPGDEDTGIEQDANIRVITLSFDTKATRTVLIDEDDYFSLPVFQPGDEIVVAQADGQAEPQTFTLTEGNFVGESATIKTTLSGPLVAVYPASCALYDSDNSNSIVDVKVPSEQDGTFANVNICMATQTDDDIAQNRLLFINKTAVFVVDLPYPEKTIQLVVESLYRISTTTGQRDEDEEYSYIACDGTGEDDYSDIITVSDKVNGLKSPCFVSVYVGDGILLRDLSFDAITEVDYFENIHTGSTGGFSPYFLEKKYLDPETATAQEGAIYAVDSNEYTLLHDYYGYGYAKWSTEDLTDYAGGEFFMWGEIIGHRYDNATSSWTNFGTEQSDCRYTGNWNGANGFDYQNSPFATPGGSITMAPKSYINTTYALSGAGTTKVLKLCDDAAYYHWGGSWHIPTSTEWGYIINSGLQNDIQYIFSPYDDSDYIVGTTAQNDTNYTNYYWSSSLGTQLNYGVYACFLMPEEITEGTYLNGRYTAGNYRYYGMRICPVAAF